MNVDRFSPRIILYTSKKYCKSKELFSEDFQSELLVKEYLGEVKQGFMLIHTAFSYRQQLVVRTIHMRIRYIPKI